MTSKRYKQRTTSLAAKFAVAGCLSCLLAGGIGFGFASANNAAPHESVSSFGIQAERVETFPTSSTSMQASAATDTPREATVLTSPASRDISKGIAALEAQEEAERRAAEEAARQEELARIAAAEAAKAQQQAASQQQASVDAMASLTDVDWSVGKEAFLAEWSGRIDAYLAGSPLAGQGATFAEAAWNNGVDPRWSPAISNTESSKGAVCFLPYNAWGWGQSSWSSWSDAINAHVAGLASNYGYTISYAHAAKYCPPNTAHWFSATLGQMQLI